MAVYSAFEAVCESEIRQVTATVRLQPVTSMAHELHKREATVAANLKLGTSYYPSDSLRKKGDFKFKIKI